MTARPVNIIASGWVSSREATVWLREGYGGREWEWEHKSKRMDWNDYDQ